MCGCCSLAATRISRLKRSKIDPAASSVEIDFDDDGAAERRFFGDEDATHSAASQLASDRVCVTETGLQLVAQVDAHRSPECG